jgi:hypothetical protein
MMAYVVGLLTDEEIAELEGRGWELEDCPAELIPRDMPIEDRGGMKMAWVDASMFEIMGGPDWEKGRTPQEEAGPATHSKTKTHK